MDEILGRLLGVGVSMLGGAVVKKVSKSKNRTIHEYGSPLAAVLFGAGYEAITGHTMDPSLLLGGGIGYGAPAVLTQSVYKGFRNEVRKEEQ